MKDLEQRKNLIDGEYTGNLLVRANSVMLKNMIINGSLMSAVVQRIGQSPLDNWTITGGGTNAVSMNSGTNMKTLIVCCVDRPIKVFFDKNSTAAVKEKIKVSVTKSGKVFPETEIIFYNQEFSIIIDKLNKLVTQ